MRRISTVQAVLFVCSEYLLLPPVSISISVSICVPDSVPLSVWALLRFFFSFLFFSFVFSFLDYMFSTTVRLVLNVALVCLPFLYSLFRIFSMIFLFLSNITTKTTTPQGLKAQNDSKYQKKNIVLNKKWAISTLLVHFMYCKLMLIVKYKLKSWSSINISNIICAISKWRAISLLSSPMYNHCSVHNPRRCSLEQVYREAQGNIYNN